MRMKKKHVKVIILTALILALVSAAPVSASNVGVSPGMWWKYGQVSSPSPPYDNVSWIKDTIQSVNGFTVSIQQLWHFTNGTENTQTLSGNIATGDGDLQMSIILGGLQKNDPVYQGGSSGWINDTFSRTYSIGKRSVDYQNITYSDFSYNQSTLSYWDQRTGFLLEVYFDYSPYIGNGLKYSLRVTEASQSALVPTFSGTASLLGVAVLTISACFALKRRMVPTFSTLRSTHRHDPSLQAKH